ncbi:MAG: sodium:solute symporter [Bacteroidetes bacterium]|nr:sodium:solute symporter [Bacteroidota bacterium]
MIVLDWLVLFGTLIFIVAYGTWKSRGSKNMEVFIKGDQQQKWWMVGLSIMATQASAVTFLSTTGQGMEDGMRFVQFYFGLPLAMIILSVTLLPIYYKLKVYTAYEYLETRFDLKTRTLAAVLFLLLRGLSVGITLFAPSLVLSTILGWNIFFTTVLIGGLVIIYTVSGGNNAVSITQRVQMTIILGGMLLAGGIAFSLLPSQVSFTDTVRIAGTLGKLNIVTTDFSWNDRYNIWSGLLASTFLFLSYFGTDQSQVARYINGKSLTEGRMGLLFNGLLKIPMQFFILFIGVLVFVFYLYNEAPLLHNEVLLKELKQSSAREEMIKLEEKFNEVKVHEKQLTENLTEAIHTNDLNQAVWAKTHFGLYKQQEDSLRREAKEIAMKVAPNTGGQDRDYAFLNFVLTHLPHGVIGLLLAVIFSAAMSSMSSELSALASTTMVDIYKRIINLKNPWLSDLAISKMLVGFWAGIAISFAALANFSENLIQFVNIVGSLFYGTILGLFVVAFYFKKVKADAVFWAAVAAEVCVLACYYFLGDRLAFLYYNIIGCAVVVLLSLVLSLGKKEFTP